MNLLHYFLELVIKYKIFDFSILRSQSIAARRPVGCCGVKTVECVDRSVFYSFVFRPVCIRTVRCFDRNENMN